MKERWNQEFFWVLELDTWTQKEKSYMLDIDEITILISGTTTTTTESIS